MESGPTFAVHISLEAAGFETAARGVDSSARAAAGGMLEAAAGAELLATAVNTLKAALAGLNLSGLAQVSTAVATASGAVAAGAQQAATATGVAAAAQAGLTQQQVAGAGAATAAATATARQTAASAALLPQVQALATAQARAVTASFEKTAALRGELAATVQGGQALARYAALQEASTIATRQGIAAGTAMAADLRAQALAQAALRQQIELTTAVKLRFQNVLAGIRGALGSAAIGFTILVAALLPLARAALDTEVQFERADRTLQAVTGSVEGAAANMAFMRGETERLGLSWLETTTDYARFLAAVKGSGITVGQARQIFSQFSEAITVLGYNSSQANRIFLALQQMAGKSQISLEELRRQLGQDLPGAMNLAAKAMGVTTAELFRMVKAGEVTAKELLPKLAEELHKAFGPGLAAAINGTQAQLNRFHNAVVQLRLDFAKGFMEGFLRSMGDLRKAMGAEDVRAAAQQLGESVGRALKAAAEGAVTLARNLRELRDALVLLGVAYYGIKLGAWAGTFETTGAAVASLATLFRTLWAVMASNPVGLVIAAVAAAGLYVNHLTNAINAEYAAELRLLSQEQDWGRQLAELMEKTRALTSAERDLWSERVRNMRVDVSAAYGDWKKLYDQVVAAQAAAKKAGPGAAAVGQFPGPTNEQLHNLSLARGHYMSLNSTFQQTQKELLLLGMGYAHLDDETEDTSEKTDELKNRQKALIERMQEMIDKARLAARAAEGLSAATANGKQAVDRHQEAVAGLNAALEAQKIVQEAIRAKVPVPPGFVELLTTLAVRTAQWGNRTEEVGRKLDAARSAVRAAVDDARGLQKVLDGLALARRGFSADFDSAAPSSVREWAEQLAEAGTRVEALRAALAQLQPVSLQAVAMQAQLAVAQRTYNDALAATPEIVARIRQIQNDQADKAAEQAARTIRDTQEQAAAYGGGVLALERYTRQHEVYQRALQAEEALVRRVGETDAEFMRRRVGLFLEVKAALEGLQDAMDRAAVSEPLRQAAEQMRTDFLDALADVVTGAKVSFSDIVRSWLRMWARAMLEWFYNWLVYLAKAKAVQVAANLGGTNGGGGVTGGLTTIGMTGGGAAASSAATGGAGGGFASFGHWMGGGSGGAALAWGAIFAAVVLVITKWLSTRGTPMGKTPLGAEGGRFTGGAEGMASWAASERNQQIALAMSRAIAKVLNDILDQLDASVTKAADVVVGKHGRGKHAYYFVDFVNAVGEHVTQKFQDMDQAMDFAAVQALRGSDLAGLSPEVAQAIRNSLATTLDVLQKDIAAGLAQLHGRLGEAGSQVYDRFKQGQQEIAQARALGLAIDGIVAARERDIASMRHQLLGIDETSSRQLEALASFNRGVDELAANAAAQVEAAERGLDAALADAGIEEGIRRVGGRLVNAAGEMVSGATEAIIDKVPGLRAALDRYTGELDKLPQRLSDDEINMGIFDVLFKYLRDSPKYAAQAHKWAQLKVELEFAAMKVQLIALSKWEQFAEMFNDAYAAAQAAAGGKPAGGGRGGGGRQERLATQDDLRREVGGLDLGPVARQIADANQWFLDLSKRIHDAGFSTAEAARLIGLAGEELARRMAAVKAQVLQETQDFLAAGTPAGGQLMTGLRDIAKRAAELKKGLEDLGRAGELAKWRVKALSEQIDAAARRQGEALVAGAAGQLMLDMYGLLGMDKEAAQLKYDLALLELDLRRAEVEAAMRLLGYTEERMRAILDPMDVLIGKIKAAGPSIFGGGGAGSGNTAPFAHAYDPDYVWVPGVGWVHQPGGGAASAAGNAHDLLQRYHEEGVDPYHRALLQLNRDFDLIRLALGNTPEVAAEYAAALERLRQQFLEGLHDFYDELRGGANSGLTVEQRFNAAAARYHELLAAVQGGDLSQAGALQAAAQQWQELAQQMFGTSTGGYGIIRDQILADLASILGLAPGTGATPGGTPDWFLSGTAQSVAATTAGADRGVSATNNVANTIDFRAARQELLLREISGKFDTLIDRVADLEGASSMMSGMTYGSDGDVRNPWSTPRGPGRR